MTAHSVLNVRAALEWGNSELYKYTTERSRLWDRSLSAALAVADDKHWNITNDPVYPACLAEFRKRHEASQASQANKSVKKSGTGGGSPTLAMTPPSATSSKPPPTPALGDHEVMELVCDILDQVYALCLETLQEMGFIWVSYQVYYVRVCQTSAHSWR